MDGQFLIRQIYDDEITYNLIGAAVEILRTYSYPFLFYFLTSKFPFWICVIIPDIPADDILELFGKTFFDFCQDSGYDKILQVLGATPRDFLQVNKNSMVETKINTLFFF